MMMIGLAALLMWLLFLPGQQFGGQTAAHVVAQTGGHGGGGGGGGPCGQQ